MSQSRTQRIVIGMMDGLDPGYVQATAMPNWQRLAKTGFSRQVSAVMPSVTNVNNVSICCGCFPNEHGISGNSYFDLDQNAPMYMNSAELIKVPTIFERAAQFGVRSGLLTSKRKTVELFSKHTTVAVAAEQPPKEYVEQFGQPENIYSSEINFWLWEVAGNWLKTRPDLGLIYVHTTDYPMHMWPPEAEPSQLHLKRIDALLGEAVAAAPDAAFFLTADHGMNFKKRCWDLARVCALKGTPLRFALSPERDYYIKHHNNYAGCSYLYLKDSDDEQPVRQILRGITGVYEVLSRQEAAIRFHLPEDTIGDLMVLADRITMFGEMDQPYAELPAQYRNHGSLFESDVPLIIYHCPPPLSEKEYRFNKDLTRGLWQ